MTEEHRLVLDNVLGWLHAGYPEGVPPKDYFALLALLKRSLTEDEVVKAAQSVLQSDRRRHRDRGTRSARAVAGGHRQGAQPRGDPPGRVAAGLGRLAAGGPRAEIACERPSAPSRGPFQFLVSRRSGCVSGTWTKISVTPSGSVTCISCRPHGSSARRAGDRHAAAAQLGLRWRRRRAPAATARRGTAAPRAGSPWPGELDQRLSGVEHRARAVLAGDGQTDVVAVELNGAAGSPPAGTAPGWPGSPYCRVYHGARARGCGSVSADSAATR